MIHGSEDAVLWLQLSEPLTVGMLGDLRRNKKERKRGKEREEEEIERGKHYTVNVIF